MSLGLPVAQVIGITVSLTPAGAAYENIDTLLIAGDSRVIDTQQRLRQYGNITEVGQDFVTTDPEYLAAEIYFGQSPAPTTLFIGRWASQPTAARLVGGILSATQQDMTNWTTITTGSFSVTVNSTLLSVSGLDFATATNLNGVASTIQTAIQALTGGTGVTCVFTAEGNFQFESGTTGTASTISFLSALGTGTDISAQLLGTSATAQYVVDGIAAETAASAVNIFNQLPTQWHGLEFAAGTNNVGFTDSDALAVAAIIEASTPASGNPHIFGVTTSDSGALSSTATTDIGAELQAGSYTRSFAQYSSESAYAATGIFAILYVVDFAGANTMTNVMWKSLLGVTSEQLTTTQAAALNGKRYNYYAMFNNGIPIVVNGMMAFNYYIDEIFGLDGFATEMQTDIFNFFASTPSKVAQTDPAIHQVVRVIESTCERFVTNGFLAPGVWTSAGFGQLTPGYMLSKGFMVYAPPVATQSAAARAARQTPVIQVAGKEAGAINDVVVSVGINR